MTGAHDTSTLGDLVATNPAAARILDGFELDYCCHGDRTLADACAARGVDPAVVAAKLADLEVEGDTTWATLDAPALAEIIVATHHRYLWEELPLLDALAAKVLGVHGERHPELSEVHQLVMALRADLEPHLLKEERVLFPAIAALAGGEREFAFGSGVAEQLLAADHISWATATEPDGDGVRGRSPGTPAVATPIRMMLAEHDRAGELLARLRTVTDAYNAPPDGCASYRSLYERLAALELDTHVHVHKENHVLFPAALRLGEQPGGAATTRRRERQLARR